MARLNLWRWITWGLLAVAGLATGLYVTWQAAQPRTPAAIAEAYFRAAYQRNYIGTWPFISQDDKAHKSKSQYLAENAPLAGAQRDLLARLAAWGEFATISTASSNPDHAIVTAVTRFPDLDQPEVRQLLDADPQAGMADLLRQLETLYAAGQIQFVEDNPAFSLSYAGGRWGIVLHWSGAVIVNLTAAVSPDLPWEFYPLQAEVKAAPGETVQVIYRVKNLADHAITAKAQHVTQSVPEGYGPFFETIQCFCFTEQTLAAGEEKDMPLIFRVDFTVPPAVTEFINGYTFYPLESFPDEMPAAPAP